MPMQNLISDKVYVHEIMYADHVWSLHLVYLSLSLYNSWLNPPPSTPTPIFLMTITYIYLAHPPNNNII